VPLAAVGLAGLDVSRLRAEVRKGAVTARVIGDIASLSSASPRADFALAQTLAGASSGNGDAVDAAAVGTFSPTLTGFAPSTPSDADTLTRASYVIEVREAKSGQLTQVVWIDRGTYFVEKVEFFRNDQRTRTIEVERLWMNQGLTVDDVLITPRVTTTLRG
jgi:hypothetical protein